MSGPGSLVELLEPGDEIISDRDFSLEPKHSYVTLIHPSFLERKG